MTKLVADIGGTNARFALLNPETNLPESIAVFPCDDHESLEPAIVAFLQQVGKTSISSAAIAVGTPITGDRLSMTNNNWSFSRTDLIQVFNLNQLKFVNDFAALALSIPHLAPERLRQVGGGQARQDYPMAIIGPGTGLGVSGLLIASNGQCIPLQGEGGHVSIAPGSLREYSVVEWMAKKFNHVSAERFLSGPGLCNLHEALRAIDGLEPEPLTPAQITHSAIDQSDPVCVEVMQIFCSQLGSCAANLALTLGAEGGVIIGGGIVPRLGPWFDKSLFRQSFESKGRMSGYLSRISTRVVLEEYPALIGAATLLADS